MKDIVIIQRYLADLEALNNSQIFVASGGRYGDIDMKTVTNMQRTMAELEELEIGESFRQAVEGDITDLCDGETRTIYPTTSIRPYFLIQLDEL